jgi:uncharacterized repeat protein (TIGR03803 family)
MNKQLQHFALLFLVPFSIAISTVCAQQTEFYGMTVKGGEFNSGTIFKTDSYGNNLQLVFSFPVINNGNLPVGKLCEAKSGKLYGMTGSGGNYEKGVLFEWDPLTNILTKKVDFNGTENGRWPSGSLVLASNEKLYGTTGYGGIYDKGILFEWDPVTNTFTKILDFNGIEYGSHPAGTLIRANNGKFYGTTPHGGENDLGTIFEWDPINMIFCKRFDFDLVENGSESYGSLIQAFNGKFYGVTWSGGINGDGVLFEWDEVTNNYAKKLDFNGVENGREAQGSLIQADNGKLYGMTSTGGEYDNGVFFEWDTETDTYIKKIDFDETENGRYSYGSLLNAGHGKLYGLTTFGGLYSQGVLFEWDPSNDLYTKKLDFNYLENGGLPTFLMRTNNNKIYVMTVSGSVNEGGAIVECDPVLNVYSKKIGFENYFAENGKYPNGTLVQADNGKLYGMTSQGGVGSDTAYGSYFNGVIFEFDPVTNIYAKKFDFKWCETGGNSTGSLVKGINGKLYGMTPEGGLYYDSTSGLVSHGVLFEWDPFIDTFSIKYKFNNINGSYPLGSLLQANDGYLYGMTSEGGTYGYGVIFAFDPVMAILTKKFDFNLDIDGGDPRGSLIQAENGILYGTTYSGGENNYGVLFEWDPATESYMKRLDFNGEEFGRAPGGSVVQAANGKLYGMTEEGGTYNFGVLFEWDIVSNTVTKKIDFNGSENGAYPKGSIIQGNNGKFYGMTSSGGAYDYGVLFEWDPLADNLIVKYNFQENKKELKYQIPRICTSVLKSSEIRSENGKCPKDILIRPDFFSDANSRKFEYKNIDGKYFRGGLLEITCLSSNSINPTACDFAENLMLYPNPNDGSFSIDLGKVYSNAFVTIAAPDGRILQREERDDARIMDVKMDAQPGIYLVTINTDKERAVFKLVKD